MKQYESITRLLFVGLLLAGIIVGYADAQHDTKPIQGNLEKRTTTLPVALRLIDATDPLLLEVTISGTTTITVNGTKLSFEGGREIKGQTTVPLSQGTGYTFTKSYTFDAKIDSTFLMAESTIVDTTGAPFRWSFTPSQTGMYTVQVDDKIDGLSIDMKGEGTWKPTDEYPDPPAKFSSIGTTVKFGSVTVQATTDKPMPKGARLTYSGNATGTLVSDTTVTRKNSPPVLASVSIQPSRPDGQSILSAVIDASDPDGDQLTTSYQWFVNGTVVTGASSSVLYPSFFRAEPLFTMDYSTYSDSQSLNSIVAGLNRGYLPGDLNYELARHGIMLSNPRVSGRSGNSWVIEEGNRRYTVTDSLEVAEQDVVFVKVKVSDGQGSTTRESAYTEISWPVTEDGSPVIITYPRIISPGMAHVDEGNKLSLQIEVWDKNNISGLTYAFHGLPFDDRNDKTEDDPILDGPTVTEWGNDGGAMVFDLEWTPAYSTVSRAQGLRTFSLGVTAKGSARTATATIYITVEHVDHEPVLEAEKYHQINTGDILAFDLVASQGEGTRYTFSHLPTQYGTLTTDAADSSKAHFTWDTTGMRAGNYELLFSVEDADGLTAIEKVRVSIGASGQMPPILKDDPLASPWIVDHHVREGESLTITDIYAEDPDTQESITLNLLSAPDWVDMPAPPTGNPIRGVLQATPGYEDSGSYTLTLEATDSNGLTDRQIISIVVQEMNRNPVWRAEAANAFQLTEGSAFRQDLRAIATDPDSQDTSLEFKASGLPQGAFLEGGVISWLPGYEQAGDYEFRLTVSDSRHANTTMTTHFAVTNTNRPPGIAVTGDTHIAETEALDLRIIASDPDPENAAFLYSGDSLPAWVNLDTNTGFVTNVTQPVPGIYQLILSATDDDGGTASTEVTVIVDTAVPSVPGAPTVIINQVGSQEQRDAGAYWDSVDITYTANSPDGSNVHLVFEYQQVSDGIWKPFAQTNLEMPDTEPYVLAGSQVWYPPNTTGPFQIRIHISEQGDSGLDGGPATSDILMVDNEAPPAPVIHDFERPVGAKVVTINGEVDVTNEPLGVLVEVIADGHQSLGVVPANSSWSLDLTSLVDGTYNLTAFTRDKAAHRSSDSPPVQLVVDTRKPGMWIYPMGGTINITNPQLRVDVSDNGAGIDPSSARIRVARGSETQTLIPTYSRLTYGRGQLLAQLSLAPFVVYTISAEIDDFTGVHRTSRSFDVFVSPTSPDTTPPSIQITQPEAWWNDTTLEVVGNVNDISGIDEATLELQLDGDVTPADLYFDPNTGRVTATFPTVTDGEHQIQFSVRDKSGNKGQIAHTFTTDLTPPDAPTLLLTIGNEPVGEWTRSSSAINAQITGEDSLSRSHF